MMAPEFESVLLFGCWLETFFELVDEGNETCFMWEWVFWGKVWELVFCGKVCELVFWGKVIGLDVTLIYLEVVVALLDVTGNLKWFVALVSIISSVYSSKRSIENEWWENCHYNYFSKIDPMKVGYKEGMVLFLMSGKATRRNAFPVSHKKLAMRELHTLT